MILNPYKLYKEGCILKGEEKNLAQNGYDLRLKTVYEVTTNLNSTLIANNKGIKNNACVIVKSRYIRGRKGLYYLLKKYIPYEVKTIEKVQIPNNAIGIVFSRSTFNRNGIIIRATLFDSGFKGQPSLAIYPFQDIYITKGIRIAQIIFVKAEAYKLYNGKYQEK